MQTDVRDVDILNQTLLFLSQQKSEIEDKVNTMLRVINTKRDETFNELHISNNLLNIAKATEIQKQTVLVQKTAQLSRALQQQAAALSSGFPPAIAAATSFVAKATYEENIANVEYQKARQNRINMEKRVELVNATMQHIDKLKEDSTIQFNSQVNMVNNLIETANVRLNKADVHLKDYLSSNTTNITDSVINTLDRGTISIEKYFKSIGITDLEQKLLDSGKVERSHGKIVAKRDETFSISYTDGNKRTNKQRMEDGLAPIGIDNKSIELHHLKQKENGVILELTSDEHNANSKVLHRYETETQINRGEFIKWKKKYWKDRAKEFEC